MTFTKLTALILVASLTLSACATQTFTFAENAGQLERETRTNFFIGGLGQDDLIEAADICDGAENITKVESEYDPLDVILNILTNGIYSPRAYRVYCAR
ncbi:MAG: lipoprotein bor [Pseudomonadota bacterium]